jgi:hypothetical protein
MIIRSHCLAAAAASALPAKPASRGMRGLLQQLMREENGVRNHCSADAPLGQEASGVTYENDCQERARPSAIRSSARLSGRRVSHLCGLKAQDEMGHRSRNQALWIWLTACGQPTMTPGR